MKMMSLLSLEFLKISSFSGGINKNFDQDFTDLKSEEIDVTSDQKFVGEVVERNVFSAASLQKYIDCPYSYYLRYEERKSHHLIYHSVPKQERDSRA